MLHLRRFKEVIVSYGIHSPFVKQMLNSWSMYKRTIPQDWGSLVTAVFAAWVSFTMEDLVERWRLRPLDSEVGLEVWKSPKTNFLETEITLMYKGNLYILTIH